MDPMYFIALITTSSRISASMLKLGSPQRHITFSYYTLISYHSDRKTADIEYMFCEWKNAILAILIQKDH